MRPNAIYSKSGKGVQEASGKTSLLKREHRVVLAAIDGRATLADEAQKSGNEYDADFQRLIIQLDKDGFIREVSSGTAASPAAAAARPAGKLDTAIDLDFSSLASSQKANTAPQPTRPPPPPAPKAPAVDMAAKAGAERRAKEQESALHRARKEAEEKARREAEALLRQIEEERKAREAAERSTREEMSRARQERDERASRAEERKHKPEGPAEAPPPAPRPQAAPGSDKFADSLFADLEAFNQREEESRKQDEETERAKKEERLRKAREMEERRAREEEEQRKAEEKQLAREEEQRRAKEEEERLARENEERERKFREEEDKRARESEERSRKAKEEAILAAKTRGDMASGGDTSVQDRRAKAMKRGPGVAAAYRRQERNWGKPVTVALVVILGVALVALHVIPISTADYEKAAREALGQPVRLGS